MDCTTRRGYRQHHELLQLELGQWACQGQLSLTPKHQRIVHTLDWLDLPGLLGYAGKPAGPPERSLGPHPSGQHANLKDVLARMPTHKNSQIEGLLPPRWQPASH